MNKDRRKEIAKAVALLQPLIGQLEEIRSIVETVAQEERDYYDNMPENMQSGENGERADQAASDLEEVQSALDEIDLEDLISKLEGAAE